MTGQELEVVEAAPLARVAVAPQVQAEELVSRLTVIREAMQTAMQENVDYGVIPGTGSKPTLLKPGAEKLGALFQLDVQLENEKTWHDDGHLTVVSRATVFHQPTGARLGSGEGICTTREAKYAYRQAERTCPSCGKPAIIKGKQEYGGGWVCFKKKDGCGAKFHDGETSIEGQKAGKVPNENLADTYNTVDKMASKRARVDAVLAVTGASALFTQDVEDLPHADGGTVRQDGIAAGDATRGANTCVPATAQPDGSSTGEWRWPSGKHSGKTLGEAGQSYIEWYAAGGPKEDIRARCAEWLEAQGRAAADLTCVECGGRDGAHSESCSMSVPF